jgi:hypothetical protein
MPRPGEVVSLVRLVGVASESSISVHSVCAISALTRVPFALCLSEFPAVWSGGVVVDAPFDQS